MISISYPPISTGGGGIGDLQAVTDIGSNTTNTIEVLPTTGQNRAAMSANISYGDIGLTNINLDAAGVECKSSPVSRWR